MSPHVKPPGFSATIEELSAFGSLSTRARADATLTAIEERSGGRISIATLRKIAREHRALADAFDDILDERMREIIRGFNEVLDRPVSVAHFIERDAERLYQKLSGPRSVALVWFATKKGPKPKESLCARLYADGFADPDGLTHDGQAVIDYMIKHDLVGLRARERHGMPQASMPPVPTDRRTDGPTANGSTATSASTAP